MKSRKLRRIWGKPWDFAYLLELEQYKIREMCKYFKKSQLTVGWELQVRDLTICDKLISIVLEEDKEYLGWLRANYGSLGKAKNTNLSVYVNTRNSKRFLPLANLKEINQRPFLIEHFKISLRQQKALYLYNKIRAYRMERWWD